jgi:hypothetical protein
VKEVFIYSRKFALPHLLKIERVFREIKRRGKGKGSRKRSKFTHELMAQRNSRRTISTQHSRVRHMSLQGMMGYVVWVM